MLARYIKMQLLVLLCGGLVGPIFLIVYYFTQDIPFAGAQMGWMFWAGLLITVADVLIALALTNWSTKSAAKSEFLEEHGVLALAQITGMAETGTRINEQPLVKLFLRISGPGIAPFDSEDRVIANFTRMGNLNARKVVVIVNPLTSEYQIDWERSALVNGLVPAQFASEREGTTYDLTGQAEPLMEILQLLKSNNIALNRMVDVRSNPGLAQQINSIARRAAERQAGPAAAAPSASVSDRLAELDSLRASGVVNDQEYAAKRAQIISEI